MRKNPAGKCHEAIRIDLKGGIMNKILLIGCNGRMGQAVTTAASAQTDLSIVAGVDIHATNSGTYPVYPSLAMVREKADVIIDFSHPSGLEDALKYATDAGLPIVMATTGLDAEQLGLLANASGDVAVLRSANMSVGVNLLIDLVVKAARALYKDFDMEIIEKHHNQKLDAPSGTALAIADAINAALDPVKMDIVHDRHGQNTKRTNHEIGIHAVRGGTIAGEHTVLFAGRDELLEIRHTAISRTIFAEGALAAARFLIGKAPGFYTMRDMFSE